MSNCLIKIKSIGILGIGISLGCLNILFGFDLSEEIYYSFKSIYDKGIADEYLDSAYDAKYPEDPFLDNLNNLDGMQKQVKVAGAQYIEDELRANNCTLTKKEIWGVLYYYVPEFREEIARNLKVKETYSTKKFTFDEDKVKNYCKKYYKCEQRANAEYEQKAFGRYKNIKASSSNDMMTKCKNYFQSAYAKGSENEKRNQGVKGAWAGNDKYRNASTDDSPYDIMSDLNNVGVFLYEESTEPITPVFYNLPVFSNSAQSLLNNMNSNNGGSVGGNGNVSAGTSAGGNGGRNGGTFAGLGGIGSVDNSKNGNSSENSSKGSINLGNESVLLGQGRDNNTGKSGESGSKSDNNPGVDESSDGLGLSSEFISDVYDELVDGLGTTSLVNKGTLFYGSLCRDNEVEPEPEGNVVNVSGGGTVTVAADGGNDPQILSEEEYQEMVDYMLAAVDQYTALPEDIQESIRDLVGSLDVVNPEGGYNAPDTPDTSDEAVNQIKSCVEGCNGLRADQYLSCVEMCACGEWTSKVFDPEKTPGLGPIAKIKFCTVPGVDMKFSQGGRKIISIEEGGKEILGVVDKLSREGKLGIWTKQTNFLDSSTKKINIGKVVAISIDVQGVDLGEQPSESSKEYEEMTLKRENQELQAAYGISRPLNDPVLKNQHTLVLDVVEDDTQAERYVSISEDLDDFLDQQATLWESILEDMENMTYYAKALYEKKK